MDGSRFDELARSFARVSSRRGLLKGALGGVLAGAFGLGAAGEADAAKKCRKAKQVCRKHDDCCSKVCGPEDATGRRMCQCPPGQELCGSGCVDPATAFASDPKNCGACGTKCPGTRCAVGVCNQGVCGLAPKPNVAGRSCDDGDPCTVNDVCQADGTCAGTPKTCTPSGACRTSACQGGTCVETITAGAGCDTGKLCEPAGVCQSDGSCRGTPVTCSTAVVCRVSACDPATGQCAESLAAVGTACTPADPCHVNGQCQEDGSCLGTPKDCSGVADQCNDGVCSGGACVKQPKSNETPCDDRDACTLNNHCQDGACVSNGIVICTPNDCQTRGTCDPATGTCSYGTAAIGTTCDDGNPDCWNGVCCPAANRCPNPNGDTCCPSGKACATATVSLGEGGTRAYGACCDPGADACAAIDFVSVDVVCCAAGQTCKPLREELGDIGICCAAEVVSCDVTPLGGFSLERDQVCCAAGDACQARQVDADDVVRVCCPPENDVCLSVTLSGGPSARALCCPAGVPCQNDGTPAALCCADDRTCATSIPGLPPFASADCCVDGETCVTATTGLLDGNGGTVNACCAPGQTACPTFSYAARVQGLNVIGGVSSTCCDPGLACVQTLSGDGLTLTGTCMLID